MRRITLEPLEKPLGEDLRLERNAFLEEPDQFELLQAAALIGRIEYPDLQLVSVEETVENMVQQVRDKVPVEGDWTAHLTALVEVLFFDQGFCGDRLTYDDPQNSFLHRVLQRKRGLPITLSVLTIEVARRVGMSAFGIGFPGHFLVGVQRDTDENLTDILVIDPFSRGRPLAKADLNELLRQQFGPQRHLAPEDLMASTDAQILERMLTNLRGSYARRRDAEHLARTLSRLLLFRPEDPELFVERAAARREILDADGAKADAEEALFRASQDELRLRAEFILSQIEEEKRWLH